jgi:hypothetical protein
VGLDFRSFWVLDRSGSGQVRFQIVNFELSQVQVHLGLVNSDFELFKFGPGWILGTLISGCLRF